VANFATQISTQLKKMANELSSLLLLSKNLQRKRQIQQRTHPLEIQEAIPSVEYNDLGAA